MGGRQLPVSIPFVEKTAITEVIVGDFQIASCFMISGTRHTHCGEEWPPSSPFTVEAPQKGNWSSGDSLNSASRGIDFCRRC
jgi:hypothetical protein